ncbi:hypothetical protein [Nostoc sp.]|uniref:hypothetical protein n=1 Tax=Nostoc sp. TaxID=1180 RepID=UPI003592F6AA
MLKTFLVYLDQSNRIIGVELYFEEFIYKVNFKFLWDINAVRSLAINGVLWHKKL